MSSVTLTGHYLIDYADSKTEIVNLCVETWRYSPTSTITEHTLTLPDLKSDQPLALSDLFDHFGNP